MTSAPPPTSTSAPPAPKQTPDADAKLDEDMVFTMGPEAPKNPYYCVLAKHANLAQYRLHNENFTRMGVVLEELKEQGCVLDAKPLGCKKGSFEPKIFRAKFNPNVPLHALEDTLKMSILPMKIDDFQLKVLVNRSTFTLGDVANEANAVIQWRRGGGDMYKPWFDFNGKPCSQMVPVDNFGMGIDEAPERFNAKNQGSAYILFKGFSLTELCKTFQTAMDEKDGMGFKLKHWGVDSSDPDHPRLFIKAEGARMAFMETINESETVNVWMGSFDASEFDDRDDGVAICMLKSILSKVGESLIKKKVISRNIKTEAISLIYSQWDQTVDSRQIFKVRLDVPISEVKIFSKIMQSVNGMQIRAAAGDEEETSATCKCSFLKVNDGDGITRKVNIVDSYSMAKQIKAALYKDDGNRNAGGGVTEIKQLIEDLKTQAEEKKIFDVEQGKKFSKDISDAKKCIDGLAVTVSASSENVSGLCHTVDSIQRGMTPMFNLLPKLAQSLNLAIPDKSPEKVDITGDSPPAKLEVGGRSPDMRLSAERVRKKPNTSSFNFSEPVYPEAEDMDKMDIDALADAGGYAGMQDLGKGDGVTEEEDEAVVPDPTKVLDFINFSDPVNQENQGNVNVQSTPAVVVKSTPADHAGGVNTPADNWCPLRPTRRPSRTPWISISLLLILAPLLRVADGARMAAAASAVAGPQQGTELRWKETVMPVKGEVFGVQGACRTGVVLAAGDKLPFMVISEVLDTKAGSANERWTPCMHKHAMHAKLSEVHCGSARLPGDMLVTRDGVLHEGGLLEVTDGQMLSLQGSGYEVPVTKLQNHAEESEYVQASLYAAALCELLDRNATVPGRNLWEEALEVMTRSCINVDALRRVMHALHSLQPPARVQGHLLSCIRETAFDGRRKARSREAMVDARKAASEGVLVLKTNSSGNTYLGKGRHAEKLFKFLEDAYKKRQPAEAREVEVVEGLVFKSRRTMGDLTLSKEGQLPELPALLPARHNPPTRAVQQGVPSGGPLVATVISTGQGSGALLPALPELSPPATATVVQRGAPPVEPTIAATGTPERQATVEHEVSTLGSTRAYANEAFEDEVDLMNSLDDPAMEQEPTRSSPNLGRADEVGAPEGTEVEALEETNTHAAFQMAPRPEFVQADWPTTQREIRASRAKIDLRYSKADRDAASGSSNHDFTPACVSELLKVLGELGPRDKVVWVGPALGPEMIAIAMHCKDTMFLAIELHGTCAEICARVAQEMELDNVVVEHADILFYDSEPLRDATHVYTSHMAGGASEVGSDFADKILFISRGKTCVMPTENWAAGKSYASEKYRKSESIGISGSGGGTLSLKSRRVDEDEGRCIIESIISISGVPRRVVYESMRGLWGTIEAQSAAQENLVSGPRRSKRSPKLRAEHPIAVGQGYMLTGLHAAPDQGEIMVTTGLDPKSGHITAKMVRAAGDAPANVSSPKFSAKMYRYPLHAECLPEPLRIFARFKPLPPDDDGLGKKDPMVESLKEGREHLGFEVVKLEEDGPVLTLAAAFVERERQRNPSTADPAFNGFTALRAGAVGQAARGAGIAQAKVSATNADVLRCASHEGKNLAVAMKPHILTVTRARTTWPVAIIKDEPPVKMSRRDLMDLMWGVGNMRHAKEALKTETISFVGDCLGNSICFRSFEVFLEAVKDRIQSPRMDRDGVTELFAGMGTGAEVVLQVFPDQKVVFMAEINEKLQEMLQEWHPKATVVGDLKKAENASRIPETGRVLILTFPCQPFSAANREQAQFGGEQEREEGLDLLKKLLGPQLKSGGYDLILLENVAGILKVHQSDTTAVYTRLTTWLRDEGRAQYGDMLVTLENAISRGVPHRRQRIFWALLHKDTAGHGQNVTRTAAIDPEPKLYQTRHMGVLAGIPSKSGGRPRTDATAFGNLRLSLPAGVKSGGSWSEIHESGDRRIWWSYFETPSHGHRIGRQFVWCYLANVDAWALMWLVAEDVGLWNSTPTPLYEQKGMYLVLGLMPDGSETAFETDGSVLLDPETEAATYEGVVRAQGSDAAEVERLGLAAAQNDGSHGYCMQVRKEGQYQLIDAKTAEGSMVQTINCIECPDGNRLDIEASWKLEPDKGGKAFLVGMCTPIRDFSLPDMQCCKALAYTEYAPKGEFFGESGAPDDDGETFFSEDRKKLMIEGRVVFKGAGRAVLENPEVCNVIQSYDFASAEALPHTQPDELRRIQNLWNDKRATRALQVMEKMVTHLLVDLLGFPNNDGILKLANAALMGIGPGALTQHRHKDDPDPAVISVILAIHERTIVFQGDMDQVVDDASSQAFKPGERIVKVGLDPGDVLVFLANVCHGGGSRRNEEFFRSAGPGSKEFFNIPLEHIKLMAHWYVGENLANSRKLFSHPCHTNLEGLEGDVDLKVYASKSELGEDLNCAVCQEITHSDDNLMFICEGKYRSGSLCNRAYHAVCAGLSREDQTRLEEEGEDGEPWLCPLCVARKEKEEKEEAAEDAKAASRGGKRLRAKTP